VGINTGIASEFDDGIEKVFSGEADFSFSNFKTTEGEGGFGLFNFEGSFGNGLAQLSSEVDFPLDVCGGKVASNEDGVGGVDVDVEVPIREWGGDRKGVWLVGFRKTGKFGRFFCFCGGADGEDFDFSVVEWFDDIKVASECGFVQWASYFESSISSAGEWFVPPEEGGVSGEVEIERGVEELGNVDVSRGSVLAAEEVEGDGVYGDESFIKTELKGDILNGGDGVVLEGEFFEINACKAVDFRLIDAAAEIEIEASGGVKTLEGVNFFGDDVEGELLGGGLEAKGSIGEGAGILNPFPRLERECGREYEGWVVFSFGGAAKGEVFFWIGIEVELDVRGRDVGFVDDGEVF